MRASPSMSNVPSEDCKLVRLKAEGQSQTWKSYMDCRAPNNNPLVQSYVRNLKKQVDIKTCELSAIGN